MSNITIIKLRTEKSQNKSSLMNQNSESKFSGYEFKLDINSFQSEFFKIYE